MDVTPRCSLHLLAPQNRDRHRYWAGTPLTSYIPRKARVGVCGPAPQFVLTIPGHASLPRAAGLILGAGSVRSGPRPSHPTLITWRRGDSKGGKAGFPPFGQGGRRGGGHSAGTLSSEHLSPAACLTPSAFAVSSVGGGGL